MDRSSNGTDHEDEETEAVSTQFNTSNFGNFLEVHSTHIATTVNMWVYQSIHAGLRNLEHAHAILLTVGHGFSVHACVHLT